MPGLALQITQTPGNDIARSWVLRAMVAGRRRAFGLGPYPAVSLAAARQKAERMHRDRARTSRTLTALVAKRLVLRTIPAHDRRSALVSLTPAGSQIYEVLMPQIQAINSQILKALQPEEAAQFDEALERLQARAQTLLTELSPDLPKANRRQGQRSKEVS